MDDAAYAGVQNEPDAGGAGAPPVPNAGLGIPSVSGGPPPWEGPPTPTAPDLPAMPSNAPAIQGLLQKLDALQHPQQAAPPSRLAQVLKFLVPLVGASVAAGRGMGAEGWAQGAARADAAQQAKQRAASQQADQDAQAQERIAQAIHQLQIEDITNKRAQAIAAHQKELEAGKTAAAARQKTNDLYKFVNTQTANAAQANNWAKNALELANAHPDNISKLSVEGPNDEPIPLQKLVDLGYVSKDAKTGLYTMNSRKPPITKTVEDAGQLYSVQLDPTTNQELSRTWVGQKLDKAPPTPHFSFMPQFDETGIRQTGVLRGNTLTGELAPAPGGAGLVTRPAPGATPVARQQQMAKYAGEDVDSALAQVNAAELAGLLGPGAGRLYGQFLSGTIGSTGDPKIDQQLGGLKQSIQNLKMSYPPALTGSVRGGGAVSQLNGTLNSDKFSADLLRGSLAEMKKAADERAGTVKDTTTVGETYVKDASGKWVKQ